MMRVSKIGGVKMKKIMILLLVCTMMVSSLAGCSKEGSKTEKTDSKGGKDAVTLTFSIWDKNQLPGMQAIADAFNKENPTINVNVEVTPWDEYWTKLEASTVGGAMPDVFWMHTNEFYKYAVNKKLLPVEDASIDRSKFPQGLIDLFTYKDVLYGVPKDFDTIALIYNKELFDAAGVAYPDESWDWDRFLEVSKQLTNKEAGVYGFSTKYTTQEGIYNFVYQNGGSIITKDHKSGYGLKETQEAVKFYFDLANVHGVSESISYYAENSVSSTFASNKAAMMMRGSWNMRSFIKNEDIAKKFGIAVLPKGKKRASIYNGLTFAGSAATEYKEEVQSFLAFCASKEAHDLQAEYKAAIPAYEGTQQAWIDQFPEYNVKAFVDMLEYAIPYPTSKNKPKWEEIEKTTLKSLGIEEIESKEAFDYLTTEMDRILGQE